MKIIRILGIIHKRIRRSLPVILCAFGAGLFATHLAVCAVAGHPLHVLLAGLAALLLAVELYGLKRPVKAERL